MAKAIVKVLLKLIKGLLGAILTPLNSLIENLLASLIGVSDFLVPIQNLFAYILNIIGYVIDASCIPPQAIQMILFTLIFKYTLFISTAGIKTAIRWYRALMP